MKKNFCLIALLTLVFSFEANATEPKLVIGITIDQMRADFLARFEEHFSDGGFKRIMTGGFTCYDHHYGYAPTFTGPGHASIYTGTTPSFHGIIGNDWYDRELGKSVYCASDSEALGVGVDGIDGMDDTPLVYSLAGQMSPTRMLSNTIGDEMKLATMGVNAPKVVGISIKDRGAILPAGHSADGAYWFYGKDKGHFISSTYYFRLLPQWVIDFNNRGLAEELCNEGWSKFLTEDAYSDCAPDNNPYEGAFTGEVRPTFPYDLQHLKTANGGYDVLKATPGGNTLVVDFALAAIDGEELGADGACDLLALSFSATDYVGHRCGPHAQETLDMYVRLDRELERFFTALDKKLGRGNWTVFITSDHGAAAVPSQSASMKMPANYWSHGNLQDRLEVEMDIRFGPRDWIQNISNNAIYINPQAIRSAPASPETIQRFVADLCVEEEGVLMAIPEYDLALKASIDPIVERIYHGHSQGSSGDVMLVLNPGWMTYGRTGTTHGSPFPYDTHVPCLFYGAGIKTGATYERTYTRDIAPTISALLSIPYPNAATGSPIFDAIK